MVYTYPLEGTGLLVVSHDVFSVLILGKTFDLSWAMLKEKKFKVSSRSFWQCDVVISSSRNSHYIFPARLPEATAAEGSIMSLTTAGLPFCLYGEFCLCESIGQWYLVGSVTLLCTVFR